MTRSDVLRDVTRRARSAVGLSVCVALVALATGCGPLGDDDEDEPTPTSIASPASSAASPAASPAASRPRARSSPTGGAAGEDDDGTPVASPPQPADAGNTDDETPAADGDETAEGADGDGTSEDDETPAPPVVEGCEEPAELPEVQGPTERATAVEADEGVNLRAGPGANCDLLSTLQPGTPVEVISGPVDDGEFLWVKVVAADAEGWMAEEFLEPVEEEGGA